MPQETETYHIEKPNPIDEMHTLFFRSEKAMITNQCAGNKVEQSAVETTGSKEYIYLADIHNVREHNMQHNKHLTYCIDQYNFLGHEQDTTVHKSCIVVNYEVRRRQQVGRSDFHHTRYNPCEGITPHQNEAKVGR